MRFLSDKSLEAASGFARRTELYSSIAQYYIQSLILISILCGTLIPKNMLKRQVEATRGIFKIVPEGLFSSNRYIRSMVTRHEKSGKKLRNRFQL